MSTVDTSNSSAWSQTLSSLNGALSSHLQDKMLKKMDTDGSGGVDQSEFQAALEKVAGKLGIEVGEGGSELYASLDTDQDGTLNGSEVGSLMQSMLGAIGGGGTQAFVQSRGDEARFAELDSNSDGMISMEEFGIVPPGTEVITTTTTTVVSSGEEAPAESPASSLSGLAATLFAAALAGAFKGGGSGGAEEMAAGEEGAAEAEAVAEAQPEAAAAGSATTLAANDAVRGHRGHHGHHRRADVQSGDQDGNGKISGIELAAVASKANAQQAETASKRYNDTALAELSRQQSPKRRFNAAA